MQIVEKVTLEKKDQNKWFKNLVVFLAPVGIVYIVAVVGVINANNGAVRLEDFVPNQFTFGAVTLYVLNTVLDYLRKLTGK